jgi:type II secretory pathway predicted ATPase ExeA/septal ring-binding cell division protein DamX
MYHDFFGLREAPFRITPNTDFFFAGGNRGAILDALLYAIGQGEGIVKVTGEVGSGKTMLCRMLQARLPEDVLGVYLANPSVSPDEILHAIAHELELPLPVGSGRLEAMQRLTAFLLDCHAANRQVVLFVEESQGMPIATLEEIRLLSNLETDRHKLLQIVLFGQPELDALLRKPEIRQLRERITHSFTLAPLSAADIGLYLDFRLRAAGYKGPDLFGPAVVARIARASAGLTRRVNLLGDKTLLAAFSESSHAVAPRHVKAAIRDSEFAQGGEVGNRHGWALVAAALAALLLAAGGAWLLSTRQAPPALVIGPAPDRGAAPAVDAPVPAASAATPAADTTQAGPVAAEAAAPAAAATTLPATGPAAAADAAVSPQPPAAAPVPAATAPVATVVPPAAVAPVATGTPTSSASPSSLLAERLAATSAWLRTAEPDRVTIQLMGSRIEDQLDRQLRSLSRQVNADRLFVIRTRAADRPLLTVFYGDFASRSEAQAALGALPEALRAFSPHLRTVQGIRNEITAAGS